MKPYLGMYIHMHWGYNHPYAARTWTIEDWRSYATGLSALGYNLVMIWPVLETIPDPLTESDIAHLGKIGRVIDLLHSEFGMTVLITLGANVVGNERAGEFTFEKRPYFECDARLNPGNPDDVERLFRVRRTLYKYLSKADGCAVIDSDPGGYAGSTNDEFAKLLWRHLELAREFNPSGQLFYWMWAGWEEYNRMWQAVGEGRPYDFKVDPADFDAVVGKLAERPTEPWRVLSCWPQHQETVEKFGTEDRALFFPYGLVEGEPTFPLTRFEPERFSAEFSRYGPGKMRLGAMANAQTHVVQLPHTYMFSHLARGGTVENADLNGFAEGVVPGHGDLIAESWKAISGSDSVRMRQLSTRLKETVLGRATEGPYSGLLLRTPREFFDDLALQLRFRADVVDVISAVDSDSDWRPVMNQLTASWAVWQERTGFADVYLDTQGLHPVLRKIGNPEINGVLDAFEDGQEPSARHGIVHRLLGAMRDAAGSS